MKDGRDEGGKVGLRMQRFMDGLERWREGKGDGGRGQMDVQYRWMVVMEGESV